MARLLVIDDSLSVRKAIERILAPLGHQMRLAASLDAALGALRRETPDLVLCDLILPDGNGLDVCAALRGTRVPVLCISAIVNEDVRERVAASGAVGLVAKPFSAEELLAGVTRLLSNGSAGADGSAAETAAAPPPLRSGVSVRALEAAREWPGLVFAAVTAPEGWRVAQVDGRDAAAEVSEGRIAELLQLARRIVGEVRSGTFHHMVLEAEDARLVVDLLEEGEVLVLCVSHRVLLGMALLYARRFRRLAGSHGRAGLAGWKELEDRLS